MPVSPLILACSGPGAGAAIRESVVIAYFGAAFGGVATLALVYDFVRTRRTAWTLLFAALLLVIHPAWTLSAIHGDCGYLKRAASHVFTATFIGLLIWQYLVARRQV